MITIISNHNKDFLWTKPSKNKCTCNCQNKEACSLNGLHRIREVVYKSTLSNNQPNYKAGIYLSETKFLKRAFWGILANQGKELHPEITWRICHHKIITQSNLFLNKKLEKALYEVENILNKKR